LKKDEIPANLIFALRIYHITIYDSSEAREALDGKVISVQNEIAVCETIINLCENALDEMPHSVKEDNELIKNYGNSLDKKLYNAVVLRRSEKVILKSVLKMVKANLADVQKDWNFRGYGILSTYFVLTSFFDSHRYPNCKYGLMTVNKPTANRIH
jgi:hypothetical protein